jgi:hypothetical protein
MRSLWLAAAVLTFHAAALAQSIYRCGPDGRIYQQAPCADGRPIDASDPRTPEQRAAAQAVAAGEARRAAQFDRDNAPASAPEGRKAKPPKAPPAAAGHPASAPTSEKPAARDPSRPLTVRLPAKPKAAASAASS